MGKRVVLAVIAVFAAWSVLDFVIHGLILAGAYRETALLWRPCGEMKIGLMHLVVLLSAIVFVYIYAFLVSPRNAGKGLKYGLLFGLGTGASMGFGSYAVMPITETIALTWCAGVVIEAAVGGILAGAIIGKRSE